MGFEDLPADWPERPLTDEALLSDVLNLTLSHRDRMAGSLGVLICDEDQRLLMPAVIGEVDLGSSDEQRVTALTNFVDALVGGVAVHAGRIGIHLSIARRYGLSITADDVRWRRAVAAAVDAYADSVELLGVHVVTTEGSRRVPPGWTAAERAAPRADDGPLADTA